MEKQTERIDLWTLGEGREGEMYGKSTMETYITICKIDSQWEFAVWLRKLKRGSVSAWRGGRWERGCKVRGCMYTYD